VELAGPLAARNTAEEPNTITPQPREWQHGLKDGDTRYTFPAHSVIMLRFR
jgi:hypothetical protein